MNTNLSTEGDTAETRIQQFVFELGNQLFGLPTTLVEAVAPPTEIRALPHRSNEVLRGITAFHGQLRTCLDLAPLLQLPPASTCPRLFLLLRFDDWRLVSPCDAAFGVQSFDAQIAQPAGYDGSGLYTHLFENESGPIALLDAAKLVSELRHHLV